MNRLAPLLITLLVGTLDLVYGRFGWSWLAGPVAGLAVSMLRGAAQRSPVPGRGSREPAMVD